MTVRIDLNADLGESFGTWVLGDDEAMLDVVTSANVPNDSPRSALRSIRMVMARTLVRPPVPRAGKLGPVSYTHLTLPTN